MKNEPVIAALSDHTLTIVPADLVKTNKVLAIVSINLQQKKSPYFKKFFQVTPIVQQEANWDNDWFNSYE